LAVTEIQVVRPTGRASTPIPRQDAYLVICHLKEACLEYREDGFLPTRTGVHVGSASIHDLRREPVVIVDQPFHTVQWFVQRATLNLLAEEAGVPFVDDLRHQPGVSVVDEVIGSMSMALLPALRAGDQVNRVFADYLTMAFAAYLAEAYGGMQPAPCTSKGGLTPWQERQAKDMMAADLTGGTSLAMIAAACGLSASHLARAFRRSVGTPPHAWLNKQRTGRAMVLLRERRLSLSEIALECGFVDQSHFTRVFVRRVGLAPSAWRRMISQ
jgi:AraC family transcriptional regulator